MTEVFKGSFTQQEPIPEEGIAAALEVMRSGRLHRYNLAPGELGEVGLLEQEFAAYTGARIRARGDLGRLCDGHCAARGGRGPGDPVLTNAFTLAPVPGAIAAVGRGPFSSG
jgi:dTDP-4-amino-4,6-dideoxygalactose transaminase